MKTNEKFVVVLMTDNGKEKRHYFPIATPDGTLMTRRLKQLLDGKIHCRDEFTRDIHYVGMEWEKPCRILEELEQECRFLGKELLRLKNHLDFSNRANPENPFGPLDNAKISELIRKNLELYKRLKREFRELESCEPH